jgi:lipid-A-disaccharide synthase
MQNEGFKSLYPLDRLSVMGFIEPLKRLPEILAIRRGLFNHFIHNKPAVFIGIDAPDFNLSLEKSLKKNNIKTVHYVGPTVWAWRSGRIKTIKKAVSLILALFPFETRIYDENAIPVCCVGHPMADEIPLECSKEKAREKLQLMVHSKVVALLAGSREQELRYLTKDFIKTAAWLYEQDPTITFISACPNKARKEQFAQYLKELGGMPPIHLIEGQATTVMAAADAIMLASGTASLQAMLVKRPTIIAYKMSPLMFALAKRLIKVPYIGLPNLLANECIMPEFIQSQVVPEVMGKQLLAYLDETNDHKKLYAVFDKIHQLLKRNAGETAAAAISQLIKDV